MPSRIFVKIYIKEEHLCGVYTIKPGFIPLNPDINGFVQ